MDGARTIGRKILRALRRDERDETISSHEPFSSFSRSRGDVPMTLVVSEESRKIEFHSLLPKSCFRLIIDQLNDSTALLNLSHTCRFLYSACSEDELWSKLVVLKHKGENVLVFPSNAPKAWKLRYYYEAKKFSSIKEANDAALTNSTIVLTPGVYKERITVDRAMWFEGIGYNRCFSNMLNLSANSSDAVVLDRKYENSNILWISSEFSPIAWTAKDGGVSNISFRMMNTTHAFFGISVKGEGLVEGCVINFSHIFKGASITMRNCELQSLKHNSLRLDYDGCTAKLYGCFIHDGYSNGIFGGLDSYIEVDRCIIAYNGATGVEIMGGKAKITNSIICNNANNGIGCVPYLDDRGKQHTASLRYKLWICWFVFHASILLQCPEHANS